MGTQEMLFRGRAGGHGAAICQNPLTSDHYRHIMTIRDDTVFPYSRSQRGRKSLALLARQRYNPRQKEGDGMRGQGAGSAADIKRMEGLRMEGHGNIGRCTPI